MEGPHAVAEGVRAGRVLEIYATPDAAARHSDLLTTAASTAVVEEVSDRALAAMAETPHPQGIVAVCSLVTVPWSAVAAARAPRVVAVLDRVSDPGNAGTVIRTADALGVDAVVFTHGSVDPHNGKCVRSTAGSIFHLPIVVEVDPADAVAMLRESGLIVLAADGRASTPLGSAPADDLLRGPVAWVFGSEAHGLHPDLRAGVDHHVAIPMAAREGGGAESLNVATAAAICLWESTRT